MNVEAKLMHMDMVLGDKDHVELMFVGIEGEGSERQTEMTTTLRVSRERVKDFKLGDKFDLHVGRVTRDFQHDPALNPEFQNADPYLLGGERMHNVLIMQSMQGEGDRKKVQRQAFKESFYMALKIRMQDPEFREAMARDIEIANKRVK